MHAGTCPIVAPLEITPYDRFVRKYEDILQQRDFRDWKEALQRRTNPDDVLIQLFEEVILLQRDKKCKESKALHTLTLNRTLKVINSKLLSPDYFKTYAKAIAIIACKKPLKTLHRLKSAEHTFIFPSYPLTNGGHPSIQTNVLPLIANSEYFHKYFTAGFKESVAIPSSHYEVRPEVFQLLVKICTLEPREKLKEPCNAPLPEFLEAINAWSFDQKKFVGYLNKSVCRRQDMRSLFLTAANLREKKDSSKREAGL